MVVNPLKKGILNAVHSAPVSTVNKNKINPSVIKAINFKTPVATPSVGQQNAKPAFDMEGAFGEMKSMYEGRMTALEKLINDMVNKNKYNANQPQTPNTSQGVYDGSHIFTAPNQGSAVGSTQSNNGINDTLNKYLQSIWNGGF